MIHYEQFTLDNGLRLIVHEDTATPMAVVNVMYDVGARDENPAQTGFAHLFEHLMFGGSINIPEYDDPLQMAGGENNAYTTNDLTNYYCTLPIQNIETAFWLESDRMLSLAFSEKSLDVQRKVVCEEFKEHYINKPYGDVWHKMRALCYQTHPYQWMTIGKELSHVENATLQDVKNFFFKHYRPANAIVSVAGNVNTQKVLELTQKWFGGIESGDKYVRSIPAEAPQTEARRLEVKADVPLDAFYKCWHMSNRTSNRYYAADLITEVLGGGGSSRLHQSLVKEQKLFSNIECYHHGTTDPGLITVEGKLVKGVTMEAAEKAIAVEIDKMQQHAISDKELEKIKNKTESVIAFEDIGIMNRANSLAYYELLGNANLMNEELDKYQAVTTADILTECETVFAEHNSSTLCYYAQN
jgi:zinc protease